MILIMRKNDINTNALNALTQGSMERYSFFPEVDFSNTTDTSLTILDLSGNGSFQHNLAAVPLANYLIEKGLTNSIQSINLLVSDINLEHAMLAYAPNLAEAFTAHNKTLQVNAIRGKGYLATCIVPPANKGEDWTFYGTNTTFITNKISRPFENGLEWVLSQKDKIFLLWQGKNLSDLFNQYGMKFNSNKTSEPQLNTASGTFPGTLFPKKTEAKSESNTPTSSSYSSSDEEIFSKAKETLDVIANNSKTCDFFLSLDTKRFSELNEAFSKANDIRQVNTTFTKSINNNKQ
jgi:hypothetical protein